MEKNKKNKVNQAINFIEELSWLIERKNISLKEIPIILRENFKEDLPDQMNLFRNSIKKSTNRHFLVGVLPELFQDNEMFKNTSELLDFAESVLKISISRASKRSRNEYIGWIICEVTKLNDEQLFVLVDALSNIMGNETKLKQIKEAKKQPNFSWNDTILKLSKL